MPKISVLIPMFNRKHYIEQSINSVLAQTFQDFEIIVRDDGSTDGSADFVAEKYSAEISSGKIKLRRNEKNIGEFPTDNRLLREATGKYIMILHSDDMYLPHALEHMYSVAENFNADVVHECKYLTTAPDGVIKKGTPLQLVNYDRNQVNKVTVMPDAPMTRLNEWLSGGTGIDAPHNIFNRKFFTDNDLHFESSDGNRLFAFKWIMKAKILIKTPVPFYIYRNSPDSLSNAESTSEGVAKFISEMIELSRHLDKFFASDDFFKDKPNLRYIVRSNLFTELDAFWVVRKKIYRNGITPELNRAVEEAFKKYFGDDAAFPIFLFHWIHATFCGRSGRTITPPQST